MSKSKTTKKIFKDESPSESDSSSEDEVIKKLYKQVKKTKISNDSDEEKPKPKAKRGFKSEESKAKMAEILRAGREKAKLKREENLKAKKQIADDYEESKKGVEGVSKKKTMADPNPAMDIKPEPKATSDTKPAAPTRILLIGNSNATKFWYT
jgi:hypothetical protein